MTFRGHGKESWGKHIIESVSLCCSILFLYVPNPNKIVELWISHQTVYCCMAFSNGIDSGWAKIKYIVHLSEIVSVWIVAHEEYKMKCSAKSKIIVWKVPFICLRTHHQFQQSMEKNIDRQLIALTASPI